MSKRSSHKQHGLAEFFSFLILKDLIALTFLFLCAFTLLSLVSFSVNDPSWFTATSQKKIANLGGIIGSHWSALLLQVFGACAFLISLVFALSGIALFRKISSLHWWLACCNYLFLIITASASFSFLHTDLHLRGARFPMGGLLGYTIGGFFYRYLNTGGAILLTSFLFLVAISLSLQINIRDLVFHVGNACGRIAIFLFTLVYVSCIKLNQKIQSSLDRCKIALNRFLKEKFPKVGEKTNRILETCFSESKVEAVSNTEEPEIKNMATIIPAQTETTSTAALPDITPAESTEPVAPVSAFDPFVDMMKKASRIHTKTLQAVLGKKHVVPFELPPLAFLQSPKQNDPAFTREELLATSRLVEEKLADFKVQGKVTAVNPGPIVTTFEFKPGAGVKVQTIANLSDDLALALSAESVRIVGPIPGRDVVGIEVPNRKRNSVYLKEILSSPAFRDKNLAIPIAMGKDILGEPVAADLRKMPHMLIAGATGSGKSVYINALICSLLYNFTPDELKFIMVDPKLLELSVYQGIPHLLLPVVTEPKKASLALRWAVEEMERRYQLIARSGMRDVDGFNRKLESIGEEKMAELIRNSHGGEDLNYDAESLEDMPKIIIVIDELADLMMTAKADVENNICRLAQKARAAGIHLILATQRPSVDVITGLIKANLPARISFRLSSKNDSRTIFDSMGAERLVGDGDMLFMPPGESRLVRLHGGYVNEDEIQQITKFWCNQASPEYRDEILVDPEEEMEALALEDGDDSLYKDALDIVMGLGYASASMLQRRLRIGYNRAARMVELMEARGIVGPAEGAKPRPVLLQRDL